MKSQPLLEASQRRHNIVSPSDFVVKLRDSAFEKKSGEHSFRFFVDQ